MESLSLSCILSQGRCYYNISFVDYTAPSTDMCAMSHPTQPEVVNLCAHMGRFTLRIKLRALRSLGWVSLGASRVFPAEPIVVLVYRCNSECFTWGWRLVSWSSWATVTKRHRLGNLYKEFLGLLEQVEDEWPLGICCLCDSLRSCGTRAKVIWGLFCKDTEHSEQLHFWSPLHSPTSSDHHFTCQEFHPQTLKEQQ